MLPAEGDPERGEKRPPGPEESEDGTCGDHTSLTRRSGDPEGRQLGEGQLQSPGLPGTDGHPVWTLSQQDQSQEEVS